MKQRIVVLIISIPLVLLLAYLLKDSIHRYILAPILYTLRIERILYETLPQSIYWGVFLLILAVVSFRTLVRGRQSTSVEVEFPKEERMSRARLWSRWIEMSHRGNYSKWLLARHFADLTLNILVYQERKPLERIQSQIVNKEEDIPTEIRDYLQVGLNMPSFRHYSEFLGFRRWLRLPSRYAFTHFIRSTLRFGKILPANSAPPGGSPLTAGSILPTAPLNLNPEIIVQFLETKIYTGGSK